MEKARYSAFGLNEDRFTDLAKLTRHCIMNGFVEMPGPAFDEADDYLVVERLRLCVEQNTLRCTDGAEGTRADELVDTVYCWVKLSADNLMILFLDEWDWEEFGLIFDGPASEAVDWDPWLKKDLYVDGGSLDVDWNKLVKKDMDAGGAALDDDQGSAAAAAAAIAGPSTVHPCEVCGGVYATHKVLRRHILTSCKNHPEFPEPIYGCSKCDKKFGRLEVLKKHKIGCHADK